MFELIEFILNKGLVECKIINYILERKRKNRRGEENKANAVENAEELMSRSMMKKHFLGKVCKQESQRYKRFYLVMFAIYPR